MSNPRSFAERFGDFMLSTGSPNIPIDWLEIEKTVGLALPSDYKEICERHPNMILADYVVVYNFAARNGRDLEEVLRFLDDALDLREDFPETAPYPLFPEQGGVYPWGATFDNGVLWWKTTGHPDSWHVVAQARDSQPEDWWEYPFSTAEFLVKVLSQEIRCQLFPDDFPSN